MNKRANPHEEFKTRKEFASQVKVTVRTVDNWIRANKLKIRRAGRRVLISEGEIRRFLGEE